MLIKFKGIDKIEEAELLKNSYILINREDEEPLEEGVYYIVDLLGLDVYTDENILLGNLEDIYNTGSNDIYVVKDENGKQILLPGIPDVIKEVDIENKKIIVHLLKRTNLNMEDIMKFDVLTLFPEMFNCLNESILGRAIEKDLININLINIRDFSKDKHKKVDDTPYGGGAGMVIRPDVVYDAYCSIENRENVKVIYISEKSEKKKLKNIISKFYKKMNDRSFYTEWLNEKITNDYENENFVFVVNGKADFVEKVNEFLDINESQGYVINCYDIFDTEISTSEIIKKHEFYINTTGIVKKEALNL